MLLNQSDLDKINQQLVDLFGYFSGSQPRYRVVWSESQFEKRLSYFTKEGLSLPNPQIVEVPKYRQWIHDKYVFERLTAIPENHQELAVGSLSYEPIWVFEDKHGNALPPNIGACQFIIKAMYDAGRGHTYGAKYKTTTEEERQKAIKRVDEIEEALYGNETSVGDSLARDSAVGYGVRQRSDGFNPVEKVITASKGVK